MNSGHAEKENLYSPRTLEREEIEPYGAQCERSGMNHESCEGSRMKKDACFSDSKT